MQNFKKWNRFHVKELAHSMLLSCKGVNELNETPWKAPKRQPFSRRKLAHDTYSHANLNNPKHDSMQNVRIMQATTMQRQNFTMPWQHLHANKNGKQKTPCEPIRGNEAPSWTHKRTCALKREKGELKHQKGSPPMHIQGFHAKKGQITTRLTAWGEHEFN